MISVKGLSFSFFSSERKALDRVSLDIGDGEFVAITGPSGCGKSTLALAMGGYIPHVFQGRMQGSVTVDGRSTAEASLSELASTICIVQQDPESQLCTLNVSDEVSFGPENLGLGVEEVLKRVDESLALVGAIHLKDRQVYELSGGEKQRVAIASMLAMRPKALILDEPTSSLDPSCASSVLSAIERLRAETGMTIIVIEHKLNRLMRLADRLVVMDSGRVVADGVPDDAICRNYGRPMHARPKPAGDRKPAVEVSGLRASYGGVEVLHGVDLKAYPSEVLGIIGPNGSGKTTLLRILMGLHGYDSGKVTVLGLDPARARASGMARRCGLVFQNPNHQIFEKTVYDEAAFASRNLGLGGHETLVMGALERYGLACYAKAHPLGLSFGEKRRLNLCSILPHGPALILLDEPFVGQDYANVARMRAELLRLKEDGKAIILVSHDIDSVYKYCDRIVLLKDGKVLVDDTPEEAAVQIRAMGLTDYVPEGGLDEN
ncbi:putative ABC-type cobalt transport system, ATPase component [Methanocella conradii HZ254]|uniref:ABC-type cobalt transport system, ATPase component n=1 Tax=Methanocella conradii (strain DSM 24694 / JCM 17849 / CGMCC 1.5162 / HZ254) TaxID=1041930 RepID=H8I5G3_METCZ|nr:ATP-binding cassette domain-containing protein [Methanocella conradii]AFC98857.1 putative ABC-type cobalt transport system, ATPase component [Methanocella conradii HZ254]